MQECQPLGFVRAVENHEEPEILLYLQAMELDWHSFMDVGKRHKTPGSEAKN